MTYQSGKAVATYELDISQARRAAQELKTLFAGLKADAAALGQAAARPQSGGASARQFGPTAQDTAQISAYANAQARLVQIENTGANALRGLTQAEQIYKQALTQVNTNSIEAIRLQTQLAQVQNRIANISGGGGQILPRSLENFGPQALQQIQSGLLGVIGPAALVTAGFSAATKTVESFVEAFKFKAELDQNTASITAQLRGVRDSGQAFQQAAAFADKYKVTQEDTTTAIQASVPLLRQSKSSLTDVLTVLSQLQVLKPEQGIQGAAFALAELQGGQSRSLATRFNIPIAKATEMKNEIIKGGDAVKILGDYLDKAGIGAEALETRTKGAAGAMNDLAIAQERLKLAQAELATGPGVNFIEAFSAAIGDLTKSLGGGGGSIFKNNTALIEANAGALVAFQATLVRTGDFERALAVAAETRAQIYRDLGPVTGRLSAATDRLKDDTVGLTDAMRGSGSAISEELQKKIDSTIETAGLAQQQKQLDADSRAAAVGMLGAGDQALILAKKYGIATEQAQFLINQQQQLSNATALADQRKGEQTGTDLTAKQFDAFSKLRRGREQEDAADAKRAADKAKSEAAQVRSAQDALNLARARTKEQKIAELQRQQSATTDQAEKLRLQAQIEQERQAKVAGAGRVSAAVTTADQLLRTEENSQAQLLKAQREGIERLRDQQEDFDVSKSRKQEDEAKKIRRLFAEGKRAEAAREQADFVLSQKRDQEDFDRQKRRTVRNNAESTGDITGRTDLTQEQIGRRAALRGVKNAGIAGDVTPLAAPTPAGFAQASAQGAPPSVITLKVQIAPSAVQIDGHTIVEMTWPEFEQRVDTALAEDLNIIIPSTQNQNALGGSR